MQLCEILTNLTSCWWLTGCRTCRGTLGVGWRKLTIAVRQYAWAGSASERQEHAAIKFIRIHYVVDNSHGSSGWLHTSKRKNSISAQVPSCPLKHYRKHHPRSARASRIHLIRSRAQERGCIVDGATGVKEVYIHFVHVSGHCLFLRPHKVFKLLNPSLSVHALGWSFDISAARSIFLAWRPPAGKRALETWHRRARSSGLCGDI